MYAVAYYIIMIGLVHQLGQKLGEVKDIMTVYLRSY